MMENQSTHAKTKSLLKRKKTAIIVFSALALLLIAAIIIANYFVRIKKVTLDGTTYTLKPKDGQYSMFRENGEELKTTDDGYYVLDSGSLARLDRESGDAEVYVRIDTTGTEKLSDDGRILIFEYIPRENIKSISVKNENGKYSFSGEKKQDGNSTSVVFTIDGYPDTLYSGEKFSELIACSGYAKAVRIDKEISLDKYGYGEYGLEEARAEYTIRTFDGKEYTVWVGDKTPDGKGYYVRYKSDDRYALYILTSTEYIEDTLLSPVEGMVKSVLNLTYNSTSDSASISTDYIDVQNCRLTHYTYGADGSASGSVYSHFSYISYLPDGTKRLQSEYKSQPFVGLGEMAAYIPSTNSINEMLYNLNTLTFIGTRHLGTEKAALEKYGLDKPSAVLEFEHTDSSDKDNPVKDTQKIYFSEKTPDGTYFAYAEITRNGQKLASYDQIVEVDADLLDFLSYGKMNWVEQNYFFMYMEFCNIIEIKRGDDTYTFSLDHQSGKEDVVMLDHNGKVITLSNEDVSYYDSEGNKKTAKSSKSIFRSFYTMLETSAIMGEHGLTDAEKKSFITDDNDILSIKITTTSGRILTFKYYRMSDVRSLFYAKTEKSPFVSTGNPESSDFYALTGRADKIWSDVQTVMRAAELFAAGEYEEYSSITISSK